MDVSATSISPSDIDSIHAGWLSKQDDASKTWKKKWYVVGSDFSLYSFKSQDGVLSGKIELTSYSVEDAKETRQPNAFKLSQPGSRVHFFATESDQEMSLWIRVLVASAAGKSLDLNTRSSVPIVPATLPVSLPTPSSAPPVRIPLPGGMPPKTALKPQLSMPTSLPSSSTPPPSSAAQLSAPVPVPRASKPTPKTKPAFVPPPKVFGEPMVAQYDCAPSHPDELAFEEGDTLYIRDKTDSSWWKAATKDGKEGLVPSNYF